MIIHVTTEDLQKGEANDCIRCPVARAICRQVADVEVIEVDSDFIRIQCVCGPVQRIETPEHVAEAIDRIDMGLAHSTLPFSFELPL